jgi:hypothetical protein
MALDSTSTDAQVVAAYNDYSRWRTTGSADDARLFVQAGELLLVRQPAAMAADGHSMTLNSQQIQRAVDDAKAWLRSNGGEAATSTGSGVNRVLHRSFGGLRT